MKTIAQRNNIILTKIRIRMRICNLWRNVSVLLVAGCICCAMPSCSDDDAPAVIEAAQPCASAYELNEVGDVALEFEVIPENAQVNEVKS